MPKKILLCTNSFYQIAHGPAKFANLILQINELYPEIEVQILTEDSANILSPRVYHITINIPRIFHALGKFIRMIAYHRAAQKIYRIYPFDYLVFNDAIQGFIAGFFWRNQLKVLGMLNDFETIRVRYTPIEYSRKWGIRMIYWPFECLASHLFHRTITNSKKLQQTVCKYYHVSSKKVVYLYKSIDLSLLPEREILGQEFDLPIRILFVKSDIQIGRLHILAAALQQLHQYKFELITIGPLDQFEAILHELINPIPNINLIFKGIQPQPMVFQEMQVCDILCIPSIREGLGVANMEGLAIGIPVVSTYTGGIPEVLDDGKNGWLAQPDDIDDLAFQLESCIKSPEERQKRSIRGRAFVKAHFNHELMLKNFLEIIRS